MKKLFSILLACVFLLTACSTGNDPDSPSGSSGGSSSGSKNGKAPKVYLKESKIYHISIQVRYKVESDSKLTDYQIYYGENSKCKKATSTVKEGDILRATVTCGEGETLYFKAVVSNKYGTTTSSVSAITSAE